ncbi:low molecular weight phosphatase family protein [Chelatococcus sp. GCM10030263]|uniref:arsenate-mycothiol transferase ArsC n=1 Tax=Chelatococcus sp. GCM10030263 TaxID=3273387 RepID=UPI003621F354
MEPPPRQDRRIRAVLFMCAHNAVRSPMAAGIARHFFGRSLYVESCGVRPDDLDPFAVAAMDEVGIAIAEHRPQSLDDLVDTSFDLIVTLSPEAHHQALELTRSQALEVEYWPTYDATACHGTREQRLQAYRGVRDQLLERILGRFRRS